MGPTHVEGIAVAEVCCRPEAHAAGTAGTACAADTEGGWSEGSAVAEVCCRSGSSTACVGIVVEYRSLD